MQPKYRRRRQMAGALAIALVILLVGVTGYVFYKRQVVGKRDYNGQGNGHTVMVRVEDGDSVSGLAPELVDKGVVGSRKALILAAEKNQVDLQAGYYTLQEGMSADAALAALHDEKNRRGVVDLPTGITLDDVAVVGGKKREGIFSMVSKQTCVDQNTCISADDLKKAAGQTDLKKLNVPDWAMQPVSARGDDPRRLEGLISPGFHVFNPEASAEEIVADLVKDSVETYQETGLEQAATTVNLSPYQLITAASLVEREAPEGDFDKVARVILNRLKEKQKLEFDSTVNYSVDEQEIATTDQDRGKMTPWNTYAKEGLPDTPISSPGIKAVQAMEHPAEGDWLYFVTVDKDGKTVFNRDFADHEAAIQEARKNGVFDSAR